MNSYVQNEQHTLNGKSSNVRHVGGTIDIRLKIHPRGLYLQALGKFNNPYSYHEVVPENFEQWMPIPWYRTENDRILFSW